MSARKFQGSWWRRIAALALAPLLLLAMVTAGRTYLWCSMMDEVVTASCCMAEVDPAEDGSAGPALESGCCLHRAIDLLPAAHAATPSPEVPPGVSCVVATIPELNGRPVISSPSAEPTLPMRTSRHGPARASPSSALGRCVALQVFRC